MTEPLVDVTIAVHSSTRPIARAVASVIDHTSAAVRVNVVAHNIDPEIIRENLGAYASDPRVRLLSLHDGIPSPAGPMNHGFANSTAPFISVIGSDDELAPGAIDSWLSVQAETGATPVHPYTDPRVIAGQGTAALELLTAHPDLDALVVPLGGGGLAAGTTLSMRALAPRCKLYLAEPLGAADGARSFAKGELDHDFIPDTICDGLRGTLGAINFEILRTADAQVLTIDDAQVVPAMRLLWTRTKQLVEPSSATALAAMLANRALFEGRRVGIILSGGNIDLDALPALFAKEVQP